jgi:lipid II:glycine glycyltransferase (peptidoglycan interpeptide bridge formation enzyme)
MHELVLWARRHHYIALRVTHSSEAFLTTLAGRGTTERIDGVPFYPHPTSELYVDVSKDEATVLSGFQAVARRNIKQAREAGYVITVDRDPQAMDKAWPAFESRSAQKGISYRDLETYKRMMREAEPHRAAHLYTAWRRETPIAVILVLRDRTTAHYFLGTIDIDALGEDPSPACLLHWHAMRHAAEMGVTYYNLGTRSGPVYTFKAKFRPVEHERPAPLTVAVNLPLYRLWRRLLPVVTEVVQ